MRLRNFGIKIILILMVITLFLIGATQYTIVNRVSENADDLCWLLYRNDNMIGTLTKYIFRDKFIQNVEYYRDATVVVLNRKAGCAGVVIDAHYIITCKHILKKNRNDLKIPLTLDLTSDQYLKPQVIYLDGMDVVLMKVDKNLLELGFNKVYIANRLPDVGNTVYHIGHPCGVFRRVTKGIMSGHSREKIATDLSISYGSSGGGLFNIKGELIGIASNIFVTKKGVPLSSFSMFTSTLELRELINEVINNEETNPIQK